MKNLLTSTRFNRDAMAPVRLALTALLLGLAGLTGTLRADAPTNLPPARVSYQGFLTDGTGAPLAPTQPQNFTVDFRIFSTPSGGTPLWSERQVVTVDKGNFSVILGEGGPIAGENSLNLSGVIANRADASDRYIGLTVTIGTTPTVIQPRLRLLTTPYAFLATSARALTDFNGDTKVTWNSNQVDVTGDLSVSGVLKGNGSGLTGISSANIGTIDASKVSSGVLDSNRIPVLLGSKIGGVLGLAQIPAIDASRVPALDASKITSGALSSDRIPLELTGQRAFTGGNLGVGTTTPAAALDLESANATSTSIRIGNTTAGGKQWSIDSLGSGSSTAGRLVINDATDGKAIMTFATNQVTVTTNLNVAGALTVGASAQPLVANGGTDSLVIVRGTVGIGGGNLTGTGFTTGTDNAGGIIIYFNTRFSATPTVTVTPHNIVMASIVSVATDKVNIRCYSPANTSAAILIPFDFIAIGPR